MQRDPGSYGWLSCFLLLSLALGLASPARAQTPTPLAGLETLPLIDIPTWTSGAPATGVSAHQLPARMSSPSTLRPAPCTSRTGPIRVLARSTHGPTPTSAPLWSRAALGVSTMRARGRVRVGVLVAPDLHKLVITDRSNGGVRHHHRAPQSCLYLRLAAGTVHPARGARAARRGWRLTSWTMIH